MTFSEIEAKFKEAAEHLKEHAAAMFKHGEAVFGADVQKAWAEVKAKALVEVKDKSPEIQAAVQVALDEAEKALLTVIESHLV
jgi:capsid protein